MSPCMRSCCRNQDVTLCRASRRCARRAAARAVCAASPAAAPASWRPAPATSPMHPRGKPARYRCMSQSSTGNYLTGARARRRARPLLASSPPGAVHSVSKPQCLPGCSQVANTEHVHGVSLAAGSCQMSRYQESPDPSTAQLTVVWPPPQAKSSGGLRPRAPKRGECRACRGSGLLVCSRCKGTGYSRRM